MALVACFRVPIICLKLPAMHQQLPDNPGIFIRQRHHSNISITSRQQTIQPVFCSTGFLFYVPYHRPGSMDQQCPKVIVTLFADPLQG